MIDIRDLTEEDFGRWVVYTDGTKQGQLGRIKSWNDMWIFVVYHCADEWDNYQDYTGCATTPSDLRFEMLKPGENDIKDRFEILDL
jgi:hypothetical protein